MKKMTVDDRLEEAAGYGEMEINLFIWKPTIKRLIKNGVKVTEKYASKRKGEYYCNASWEHAEIVEDSKEPNQANYLYQMAKEAQKQRDSGH